MDRGAGGMESRTRRGWRRWIRGDGHSGRRRRRDRLGKRARGYAGVLHETSKRRGGWTRSLWQPWLGFQGSTATDGLGNVPRLGMDFSRFATKWG